MDKTHIGIQLSVIIKSAMFTLATMIPMLNAPGLAPIYMAMTKHYNSEKRNNISRRVAIGGFLLLLGASVIGTTVLGFFGISIAIVKFTGGLLLASSGLSYLKVKEFEKENRDDKEAIAAEAKAHGSSGAFYPITFPLTVGPGSISAAIALSAHISPIEIRTMNVFIGIIIGFALSSFWIYVCYRYAASMLKFLGETGTIVLLRLSAFILMCVGFQLVWNSIEILIRSLKS